MRLGPPPPRLRSTAPGTRRVLRLSGPAARPHHPFLGNAFPSCVCS